MAAPSSVTLLDGGMGQELTARWDRPATPLWSADILAERPDLVEAVHDDFIAAGADVVTLASYPVTPARLAEAGREGEFEALQAAALEAGRRACARASRDVRLAGCLPPLSGSYRAQDRPGEAAALDQYARIVDIQAREADLFLCETLACVEEARWATRAARASGRPVWTALTVDDADGTRLRSGEPVIEAARAAREEGAAAVLINCSTPEAASAGLDVLLSLDLDAGAYANGFTSIDPLLETGTVDALEAREDLGPQAYGDFAERWIASGAAIVGGCCEVGPAHIAEIARRLGRTG